MMGDLKSSSGLRKLAVLSVLVAFSGLAGLRAKTAAVDYNVVTGTSGLIMVDKVGGFVRFFDAATLQESPESAFDPSPDPGIKPHEIAISPDHKFAYVSVYGDGIYGNNPHPGHTIAIVDLKARKMVGSIDVSPNVAPHGMQVDAKGTLYVTCDLSRRVLIINPAKRQIEATIEVEGTGHWIALLPDASKLYVANKTDRPFVSVVDIKQRKMIGRVPMPNGTQGIVAAPDGSKVLVDDNSNPELAVISPASDTVVDKIPINGAPGGMYKVFYSPNGKLVLTLKNNGQMNILDANDLHGPQKIVQVGRNAMGFAFSADGKTAVVGNHSDGTASVIDLASGTITKTFPAGKGVETLEFY
jgi:DNA-binding beta-propeller fold protein YncE